MTITDGYIPIAQRVAYEGSDISSDCYFRNGGATVELMMERNGKKATFSLDKTVWDLARERGWVIDLSAAEFAGRLFCSQTNLNLQREFQT